MLRVLALGLSILLGTVAPAMAQEEAPPQPPVKPVGPLTIGDKAPPLAGYKWLRGEPVAKFEPSKVYVVHFWAAFDKQSRLCIQRLSELTQMYKDKGVTFIGVSSSDGGPDATDNGASAVENFLKQAEGSIINYSVMIDDAHKTDAAYLVASNERFPAAFIVMQDGRLAWIGHPLDGLESALQAVVDGKYDVDKALAEKKHRAEIDAKARPLNIRARKQQSEGDLKGLLATLDEIIALDPKVMGHFMFRRFQIQIEGMADYKGAFDYVREALKGPLSDDSVTLNAIAWMIVDPVRPLAQRDIPLALTLAERANTLAGSKDPSLLDTLARCQFLSGDAARALATQQTAVDLCKPLNSAEMLADLTTRLDEYKKANGQR